MSSAAECRLLAAAQLNTTAGGAHWWRNGELENKGVRLLYIGDIMGRFVCLFTHGAGVQGHVLKSPVSLVVGCNKCRWTA